MYETAVNGGWANSMWNTKTDSNKLFVSTLFRTHAKHGYFKQRHTVASLRKFGHFKIQQILLESGNKSVSQPSYGSSVLAKKTFLNESYNFFIVLNIGSEKTRMAFNLKYQKISLKFTQTPKFKGFEI